MSRQTLRALARGNRVPARSFPTATRTLSASSELPTSTKKAWLPQDDQLLMDTTRQAMVYNLSRVQNAVAEGLVPWFTSQMPASYFRQISVPDQMRHMRSLSAQFDPNTNEFIMSGTGRISLQSRSEDGKLEVTYMDFSGRRGMLADQLAELRNSNIPGTLSRIKVFSSLDGRLGFNIFSFDQGKSAPDVIHMPTDGSLPEYAAHVEAYIKEIQSGGAAASDPGMEAIAQGDGFNMEDLKAHLKRCSVTYVQHSGARSFMQQYLLFNEVANSEDVAFHAEPVNLDVSEAGLTGRSKVDTDDGLYMVRMAISNSLPLSAVDKIVQLMRHRKISVERMHLDHLAVGSEEASDDGNTVTMVRMLIKEPEGDESTGKWLHHLQREVKRLKWVDDNTIALAYTSVGQGDAKQDVGIVRAEVITCLSSILQSLLSKQDVWAFSKTNVNSVVFNPRYARHAVALADLFAARFDPEAPLPEARYQAWLEAVRSDIQNGTLEDPVAKEVLLRMTEVLDGTLRTNLYMEDRYALSLRLDQHLFVPEKFAKPYDPNSAVSKEAASARATKGPYPEGTPYGVFYVHGRRFNGFHVRFRDIARGGMRLVTPGSAEQLAIESARHFDEAHALATAQQLKNKDIPEGGSKCVVLVDTSMLPSGPDSKGLILRKSVKAFTDAMLDLIVHTPETEQQVVDLLGKQELVYLGPDEQVIPQDIDWIVGRAAQRGYPIPSAFMSSKAAAGINHKVYGVTSEGVQVFLNVALKEMNMHPTQTGEPFTVKMTGGPDGDVAGNMIKILRREYGDQVKVLGLADATGCAEDPEGLNMDELMRLVTDELPLSEFNPALLSGAEGSCLHLCSPEAHGENLTAYEEALRARNTMHNRVVADAFIPAGGRPATIHEGNWEAYLRPDNGQPSSKLIVEGANLFLTAGARKAMHAATGIPIVKDSSANKCGVICSSYEIISSMLLSHDEFAAVKPELVKDVVAKLRDLAELEAALLFREFRSLPGSLPHFSERISNAINRVTDAIADGLDAETGGDYTPFMHLFHNHLPAKLDAEAGSLVSDRIPREYLKRGVASCLASRIVYQEGIQFVEQHDNHRLAPLAFDYLKAEAHVNSLLETLDNVEWPDDEAGKTAKAIVRDGGVKAHMARHSSMSGFTK